MPHMSAAEQNLIDQRVRQEKRKPLEVLKEINKSRKKAKVKPLEHTAIYRYIGGQTFARGAKETRGRKRSLSQSDVRSLQATRRKLIQEADGEERITYKDIMDNSVLEALPSQDVVEKALRADGVRYRKPREKIQIDEADAQKRCDRAKKWIKHPPRFRRSLTYVDNKSWPMP